MLTFRDAPTLPIVIAAWSAKMEPRWFLLSAAGLVAIIPPIVAEIVLDRYMERQVLRGGTR
jgi:multiple sugar transport system permease protein